ncbi:hypothetical protein PAMC26510_33285 [Caballeronia sordidicola]|uniref:Uncharacterized protein n=1 Tax=Caballeronia sordidicola TaxID=196367 RepID=A0A242M6Q8_CABSO|nr:hypothetical protein PAMC26510_33285 [Caballeronia sordidicola]
MRHRAHGEKKAERLSDLVANPTSYNGFTYKKIGHRPVLLPQIL